MYRLYSFANVVLPDRSSQYSQDLIAPDGSVQTIGGGVYDAYASDRKQPQLPQTIKYRAMVYSATLATLRTLVESYLALVGQRGKLVRLPIDATDQHVCYARLIKVSRAYGPSNYFTRQVFLDFEFQTETHWQGAGHREICSLPVMGLPTTTWVALTLQNDGNRNQEDVVIQLTAGSAACTYFGLQLPGALVHWGWWGTLAAGQILTIDCAQKSVTINGGDSWATFGLGSNHAIDPWIKVGGAEHGWYFYSDDGVGSTPSELRFDWLDGWM